MNRTEYMNRAFKATEVVGFGKVKEAMVGYGSEPDIKLHIIADDGESMFLSAKKLYEFGVEFVVEGA